MRERSAFWWKKVILVAVPTLLVSVPGFGQAPGKDGRVFTERMTTSRGVDSAAREDFIRLKAGGARDGTLVLNDKTRLNFISLEAGDGFMKMELAGGNKLILDERLVDFSASLAEAGNRAVKSARTAEDRARPSRPGIGSLERVPEGETDLSGERRLVDVVVTLDGNETYAGLGFEIDYDRSLLLLMDGAFEGSAKGLISGIHDNDGHITAGGIGVTEDRLPTGEVLRLTFSYPAGEMVSENDIRLVRKDLFTLDGTGISGVSIDLELRRRSK